ncbi:MAG: histidinol-phosphatase [Gammaproteobacteria bacterium]
MEIGANEIFDFFDELADVAGRAVMPYFQTELTIEDKGHGRFDPVTAADRACELALRAAISRRYPSHSIAGEEYGEHIGNASVKWVIDPIDGTRSFMSGIPLWGTLIAVCERGVPTFGMMSQPYIGERFIGGQGHATWRRGAQSRDLKTRSTSRLSAASLFATSPDMFDPAHEAASFSKLAGQVRMTRYGADCYAYCALAAGHIDLVVEAGLGFHDIAAVAPIIESAGGVVTDWDGQPVRGGGAVIAAANRTLHQQALAVLGSI